MPSRKSSQNVRSKKNNLPFGGYKRSLELATAGMVEILDIERLVRLIVYMIVKKVRLTHVGILLYNDAKKSYVLTSSKGKKGSVIPKEYIRMENDDVIIKFFAERTNYLINRSGAIRKEDLLKYLKKGTVNNSLRDCIGQLRAEMEDYDVDALVPGYFQTKNLLGILFLGKKSNGSRFQQEELDFFMALARTAVMAIRNAQLYKNIQKIFYGIIKAMSLSIEKFDPDFTRPHMDRMFDMAASMVVKLERRGVVFPDIPKELFISSIFLHDIGKQYTPKEILYKEGPLTQGEWAILKKHPVDGAEIFEQIDGLEEVAAIIRYHQEKFDGSGYPEGLKGYKIPLGARIATIVDSFDAMTHSRPYRKAPFSIEDAVAELIKNKNKQFDPDLVDVFVEVLAEKGMLKDGGGSSKVGHIFNKLLSPRTVA